MIRVGMCVCVLCVWWYWCWLATMKTVATMCHRTKEECRLLYRVLCAKNMNTQFFRESTRLNWVRVQYSSVLRANVSVECVLCSIISSVATVQNAFVDSFFPVFSCLLLFGVCANRLWSEMPQGNWRIFSAKKKNWIGKWVDYAPKVTAKMISFACEY